MEIEKSNSSERNTLTIFLVLAFGITWLCWIPALIIADKQNYVLPTMANLPQLFAGGFSNVQHVFISILFSLAVYGPLIAAIVAISMETGKTGLVKLLAQMTKWRVNIKWYAFLVGIAIALALVPKLIGELAGLIQPRETALVWTAPILMGLFLKQVLTSGLGEEPGWRGFLLPYLQLRHSGGRVVWFLGIIWAVWHYPFTIFHTLSNVVDTPTIGIVITVIMALLGQTMSLVGITYIYVWLYNNTKSVFIAILFHALSNFIPEVLLIGTNPSLGIIMALMPWIVVFVLEKVYGKERFPGN